MDEFSPLDDVTVISLAINLPGPLAAARLAELGARVIKIEPPTGDPLARAVPGYYRELTGGQETITLDLKDGQARGRLDALAADADILLTAMRPKAAAGLGIPELIADHGLVHVEILGFAGDRAEVPGHDLTYQAAHGTLIPGTNPTVPIADILGGERALTAALTGLRERERLAETESTRSLGIRNRAVLDEAAAWAAGPARHGLSSPGGHLGGGSPFYRTYATADGHLAVACLEPHFAKALATRLGADEATLEAEFAREPTSTWMRFAAENDLPFEAVVAAGPGPAPGAEPASTSENRNSAPRGTEPTGERA